MDLEEPTGGAAHAGGAGDDVEVPLPQDTSAPRVARAGVSKALNRWRLASLLDSVLLAVSELVTNAVRHGRPPARLLIARRGQHVEVDVRDSSPEAPDLGGPTSGLDAESGRGMAIVAALADEVYIEEIPGDGKVVHTRFDTPRPT